MTSPRVRPRSGGRVRPGLLAPVVVAVVLGILGMHGLDAHGANRQGPMTHSVDVVAAAVTVMAGHHTAVGAAASTDDVHSAGDAASGASDRSDDRPDGMGAMVMSCVAMLAGAAVALLAVLVGRGRSPRPWAVLDPAAGARPFVSAVLRVGTGPPAVWRFSVIRC